MKDDGAATVSPVVRRRRLAIELRRLRSEAGRNLDEVAAHLECSPAKISRIETGQVGARVQDVRELLDYYQVTGPDRDALLDLVRQSRQRGWWHTYSDMISEAFRTYIGLEDEAASIRSYETHLIPGLLQTEAYSRAIMTIRRDTPLDEVDRGMRLRSTRKQILTRADPPQLWVVLDEAVLRRPVGGGDVMAEQYEHLATFAGRSNITVQVLPFSAGAHSGGSWPFTILSFADPADPVVAYVETLTIDHYLDRAADVGQYIAEFDHLRSYALSPAKTRDHLAALTGKPKPPQRRRPAR
ncbi:MAG TPA: helix-turn-helix transcriptional regulator [Mycobacteriales bacterium]|nr:helix-turn-helix transcriptional regulator [Mycobacteriales bacterium]